MVEGAHFGTARDDKAKYSIHVLEYVTRGNADDAKSLTYEDRIARGISSWLIAIRVSFAIDFDDQPALKASKIDRHLADRKLPSELQSLRPLSKLLPQKHFRQAHLPPQRTSALYLLDWCLEDACAPSTTRLRRAVPLPVPGRIAELRARHAIFPRLAMRSDFIMRGIFLEFLTTQIRETPRCSAFRLWSAIEASPTS